MGVKGDDGSALARLPQILRARWLASQRLGMESHRIAHDVAVRDTSQQDSGQSRYFGDETRPDWRADPVASD